MHVLAIFAKEPVAGRAKTRLADQTSPAFAARLADAMLRDTVRRFSHSAEWRYVVYAPHSGRDYFEQVAGAHYALELQHEGDLGARLTHFVSRHIAAEDRAVLIGADSPTLPTAIVGAAFEALGDADVVLGPATDGGYYLIGCKGPRTALFTGVPWGTSDVLYATARIVGEAGWRLHVLPPWYDIDSVEDVRMLRGYYAVLRLAGVSPGADMTERSVEEIACISRPC